MDDAVRVVRDEAVALEERVLAHIHPRHITHGGEDLGQRAARMVATGAGSWKFIIGFLVGTLLWMAAGVVFPWFPDHFPFQLYTMLVSVLAIFLAQVILLFQNRQSSIDSQLAHNSYQQIDDIDRMNRMQLEMLEAIKRLQTGLDEHVRKSGG